MNGYAHDFTNFMALKVIPSPGVAGRGDRRCRWMGATLHQAIRKKTTASGETTGRRRIYKSNLPNWADTQLAFQLAAATTEQARGEETKTREGGRLGDGGRAIK